MRGMERGPSFPQSDEMGTNFRESLPIGIKSYLALALLSPRSRYGNCLILDEIDGELLPEMVECSHAPGGKLGIFLALVQFRASPKNLTIAA